MLIIYASFNNELQIRKKMCIRTHFVVPSYRITWKFHLKQWKFCIHLIGFEIWKAKILICAKYSGLNVQLLMYLNAVFSDVCNLKGGRIGFHRKINRISIPSHSIEVQKCLQIYLCSANYLLWFQRNNWFHSVWKFN